MLKKEKSTITRGKSGETRVNSGTKRTVRGELVRENRTSREQDGKENYGVV